MTTAAAERPPAEAESAACLARACTSALRVVVTSRPESERRSTWRIAQSQKNGSSNGLVPRNSLGLEERAPSCCALSIMPSSSIRESTQSRRFSALSICLSGRNRDGLCTIPASIAASPRPRSFARFPNHPFAAASTPTRFEPNGARFRYCESIHSLSCRRSICIARNDSTYFHASVRGCGQMRREACIVRVDAPDMRRLANTFWNVARTTLSGFTPKCEKKRWSSPATSALTIQSSRSAAYDGRQSTSPLPSVTRRRRPESSRRRVPHG